MGAGNHGSTDGDDDGAGNTPALKVPRKRFLYDLQALTFNAGPRPARGTPGPGGQARSSVRHRDGGTVTVPMHLGSAPANRDGTPEPDHLPPAIVRVGIVRHRAHPGPGPRDGRCVRGTAGRASGPAQQPPRRRPHRHDHGPGTTLKVRPVDTTHGAVTSFHDYKSRS